MSQLPQFLIIVLISLFERYNCQVSRIGGCPVVTPLSNISLGDFSGKWFDVAKYSSYFVKGKCVSMDITVVSEKNVSIILNQVMDNQLHNFTHCVNADSPGLWSFEVETTFSKFTLN